MPNLARIPKDSYRLGQLKEAIRACPKCKEDDIEIQELLHPGAHLSKAVYKLRCRSCGHQTREHNTAIIYQTWLTN